MKPYKNQDPIRLVVADVDETLVTQEKVLTAKTKEAVTKLTAAGIAFAITRGRPPTRRLFEWPKSFTWAPCRPKRVFSCA